MTEQSIVDRDIDWYESMVEQEQWWQRRCHTDDEPIYAERERLAQAVVVALTAYLNSLKPKEHREMTFTPAKRGDLVVIAVRSKYTKANFQVVYYTRYHAAKVTSITRDGCVETAARPKQCQLPLTFSEKTGYSFWGCLVGSQDRLNISVDDMLIALGADASNGDLEALKRAIKIYAKDTEK